MEMDQNKDYFKFGSLECGGDFCVMYSDGETRGQFACHIPGIHTNVFLSRRDMLALRDMLNDVIPLMEPEKTAPIIDGETNKTLGGSSHV